MKSQPHTRQSAWYLCISGGRAGVTIAVWVPFDHSISIPGHSQEHSYSEVHDEPFGKVRKLGLTGVV